ncbi:MAG: lysophospholipid acyltransferase family protein [Paucibacter sp.]|nr:lysophospholipid acyltransferase family protein [Roseateles sp.]
MLALFRILSRWPLRFLHAIGAMLGWLTYLASPSYRRRMREHSAQAGLLWAQARGAVANSGRMVAELPWLWMRPAGETLGDKVQWRGRELVEAALDAGRGVLILTPHLGCFEIIAQAIAETYGARAPMTAMFRPARKEILRELVERSRDRPGLLATPATLAGVRQMIRALRKGEFVGLLPDQAPPDGLGVWVPFFGRPAYTMTLAGRLIQQTACTPLCLRGERLGGGRGFVIHVEPGPVIGPQDTPESAATAVNQAMETLIRQAPDQYLWSYNRYKAPRGLDIGAAPE